MATRRDIREAFYQHLKAAAGDLVPDNQIGLESPNSEEQHPALVYRSDSRKVPMNQASGAPSHVVRDTNGDATTEVYESVHELSTGVVVADHDEQRREDVYEAVRSYFEKYEHPAWDASDIHADAHWVRVLDATSQDDQDATPTVRGDRVLIRIGFTRDHERDVEPTTSVNRIGDTS